MSMTDYIPNGIFGAPELRNYNLGTIYNFFLG